jgi:hypothetical protein
VHAAVVAEDPDREALIGGFSGTAGWASNTQPLAPTMSTAASTSARRILAGSATRSPPASPSTMVSSHSEHEHPADAHRHRFLLGREGGAIGG